MLVAKFAKTVLPPIAAVIVILALLFNALQAEAELWLRFETVRDSLLFCAVLWLFFKLPALSLVRRPETGGTLL